MRGEKQYVSDTEGGGGGGDIMIDKTILRWKILFI